MKCSVFIAVSLDGFIARSDGSIDWLMQANEHLPQGEDGGYQDFISTIDVIIMGRHSYEKILSFDAWPYTLPVVVMSHQDINIPQHLIKQVSHSSETPQKLIERLAKKGSHRFYIDGGVTIQSFLKEDLINELIITVIPILIGQGKRLFDNLQHDISLKLIGSKDIAASLVQMHYEISKSDVAKPTCNTEA
jgi:dihydrofolate reductase